MHTHTHIFTHTHTHIHCSPNGKALYVDGFALSALCGGPDTVRHDRNVVPRVGLARDEERAVRKLRVRCEQPDGQGHAGVCERECVCVSANDVAISSRLKAGKL